MNGSIPNYNVEHELSVLEYDLLGERHMEGEAAKTSYLEIFKGTNLRRTMVSSSIMCFQQCVGISIVYGYNAGESRIVGNWTRARVDIKSSLERLACQILSSELSSSSEYIQYANK